ncbi:MAG: Na+/H+ antiporter NhaC family protein [Eubacterium sp.]|nr:Na+/H+ antiporter NhaC family protein [Candidatus Colimonas fimequi]
MVGTLWALVPPLVAIVLALITKEVYSSLFIGIVIGGFFYANGNPVGAMNHVINDGFVASLADSWNVGILIFLVILGTMVCLMNRAGGSAAFGRWAQAHIKSRVGAQLVSVALGVIIFIDDYFNCLTVGSVMLPVAEANNISRAKLAYLIDATAAPICIIAPISSWAAAVAGFVDGTDGLTLFIQAIPYNFYALLTFVFVIGIVVLKADFGPMAKDEALAIKGEDPERGTLNAAVEVLEEQGEKKGTVLDLVLPIIFLIALCVIGLIYTGGFFGGESFVNSFANSDASVGLVIGSLLAILLTLVLYLPRGIIKFTDAMACLADGFKAMVPAILILTFAWTLKAMTDSLGAKDVVAGFIEGHAAGFAMLLPAIIFLVALGLAFATGTSWGTFGILIPIVVSAFQATDPQMMIISISACMAGAVAGDHCSPISDTTIMASAGAQCNHVKHVSTQLPYVLVVAAISCLTFALAGFVHSAPICLIVGIILTIGALLVIKNLTKNKAVA